VKTARDVTRRSHAGSFTRCHLRAWGVHHHWIARATTRPADKEVGWGSAGTACSSSR
jgi:hypothetical protein